MSTKRQSKKNNKTPNLISPNQQNLHTHRKLLPNLKFQEIPIVEIDVLGNGPTVLNTANFIDKVSEYSKLPAIIESGGFFVMRPKPSHKHRYLINPSKMKHKNWNHKQHCHKHYYISHKRTNSQTQQPYNTQWVYDIPQLSKTVNDKPLLVGSYPQKTTHVLQPLFTPCNDTNNNDDFDMTKLLLPQNTNSHTQSNPRKRKRNESEIITEQTENKRRKKVRTHKPIKLPKHLRVPKRDNAFDLTQHISSDDIYKFAEAIKSEVSDNASIDSFPTSTSSYSHSTANCVNNMAMPTVILSTNIDTHALDSNVQIWDKILSAKETEPPITITDMAITCDDMPLLISSTSSPPVSAQAKLDSFRGFAFLVNQFEESNINIESFWDCDAFEHTLLHSPYDNASAEQIPLIFANDLLNTNTHTRQYGIIGDITMYDEDSPLDLINVSLYGPFAQFKEGGSDNEYMQGVHSPYIYLGNKSTWFPWHREDMNLYAVNHLLWGSDKLWYHIPPKETHKVLAYVRMQYKDYCGDIGESNECWTPLHHKQFWFDPYVLLSMGVRVYFFRQKAGDIVITPPGGLHCGINCGPNIAESLNFMTFDMQCWRTCLSAMHFALFNRCQTCLNSVWINFNTLAMRMRASESHALYAPKESVIPVIDGESMSDNICQRLSERRRSAKRKKSPISDSQGHIFWIYPVRRGDSKYWYPAIWIRQNYSWDSLQFELLYTFKYLDTQCSNKQSKEEHFTESDVLWDKGLLILDWNRKQRFEKLTNEDKALRGYEDSGVCAKKYYYPRKQGNMLLNYCAIIERDYAHMYYSKNRYFEDFESESVYKDLYKKNGKNLDWRSEEQMLSDCDRTHQFFMQMNNSKLKKRKRNKRRNIHRIRNVCDEDLLYDHFSDGIDSNSESDSDYLLILKNE